MLARCDTYDVTDRDVGSELLDEGFSGAVTFPISCLASYSSIFLR